MSHGPIYLDSQASTPVDPRVLERMLPYFSEQCGNPSTAEHQHGETARQAVEEARQTIATALGCLSEKEIIFTSGATEANNLALLGAFAKHPVSERHLVASAVEHSSVLEPLAHLQSCGAQVTLLPVDGGGRIDPKQLRAALRPETKLVSVMFANNEIGTLQPIEEIGRICRGAGILFHCDAAQAVGHEPLNVEELQIDLLSFSAHKFYGPKGIGGLYIREGIAANSLQPTQFGGGQERGLRPGTLNVPAIVGMATALQLAQEEMEQTNQLLRQTAKELFDPLQQAFPRLRLNG
ncbi:MAG: cysteine desulfurase, partial [Desulfuromonadaceae bacterium]|nr:cysteine desulfurase [Desulfuromonadaceae bacterium]